MSYSYRVIRPCFVGNTFRKPGGRHDPYVVEEKLDPCPSALELIDGDKPQRKPRSKTIASPQPDKVQGKVLSSEVKFEV